VAVREERERQRDRYRDRDRDRQREKREMGRGETLLLRGVKESLVDWYERKNHDDEELL